MQLLIMDLIIIEKREMHLSIHLSIRIDPFIYLSNKRMLEYIFDEWSPHVCSPRRTQEETDRYHLLAMLSLPLCLVDIIRTHACAHMYTRMCFKGVNIARMRSSMPDTAKTVNLLLLLSSITVSSFEEEEEKT